jgi:hypothetical protein
MDDADDDDDDGTSHGFAVMAVSVRSSCLRNGFACSFGSFCWSVPRWQSAINSRSDTGRI